MGFLTRMAPAKISVVLPMYRMKRPPKAPRMHVMAYVVVVVVVVDDDDDGGGGGGGGGGDQQCS